MKTRKAHFRNTAVAALLSLPLAVGPAIAQQAAEQSNTAGTDGTAEAPATQNGSGTGQEAPGAQEDAVVATVGDAEIRSSEVQNFIDTLPPQLKSQQPQVLVPIATEQLILRELILQEAQEENLAEDPDVVALVESSDRIAEDDAMIKVWLDRELAGTITEDAVQKAYDEAKAQGAQNLPPLESVRPQIERHLRQRAIQQVGTELRDDADIVLYDPTGKALDQGGVGAPDEEPAGAAGNATSDDEETEGSAPDD